MGSEVFKRMAQIDKAEKMVNWLLSQYAEVPYRDAVIEARNFVDNLGPYAALWKEWARRVGTTPPSDEVKDLIIEAIDRRLLPSPIVPVQLDHDPFERLPQE